MFISLITTEITVPIEGILGKWKKNNYKLFPIPRTYCNETKT